MSQPNGLISLSINGLYDFDQIVMQLNNYELLCFLLLQFHFLSTCVKISIFIYKLFIAQNSKHSCTSQPLG